MIERSGNLQARIQRWIKDNRGDAKPLYQFVNPPHAVTVREIKEAGEAHIDVSYPDGAYCVVWHLEATGYFLFLKGEKNADGVFFVCHANDSVDLHIIECKKTMGAPKWREARLQMQDSLSKALAIAGVLGIQIDNVYLGAAFRENHVDPAESSNPRVAAAPLRDDEDGTNLEANARAHALAEWRSGQVKLRGFAKPFSLAKIQLDPNTGHGTYALPNP